MAIGSQNATRFRPRQRRGGHRSFHTRRIRCRLDQSGLKSPSTPPSPLPGAVGGRGTKPCSVVMCWVSSPLSTPTGVWGLRTLKLAPKVGTSWPARFAWQTEVPCRPAPNRRTEIAGPSSTSTFDFHRRRAAVNHDRSVDFGTFQVYLSTLEYLGLCSATFFSPLTASCSSHSKHAVLDRDGSRDRVALGSPPLYIPLCLTTAVEALQLTEQGPLRSGLDGWRRHTPSSGTALDLSFQDRRPLPSSHPADLNRNISEAEMTRATALRTG
jgi:hypothetical protein